jgi:hypothetical protein
MEPIVQMIITVLSSILATSGFWAYLQHVSEKKSARSKMVLGLGHDRIVNLCKEYIDRGWISADEYENLHDYLYNPYEKMGGNGSAKRLMAMVQNLPIHSS